MKLCVYCGTFNPIHNAHIEVAKFVKENYNFDKIIFIPAYKPPHKDTALSNHRFNMVKLAVKNIDGFEISDIEYKSEENSYTYNTLTKLYEIYPEIEGKINFIIGTDAFRNIKSWYNTDGLKSLAHFIVFERENNFDKNNFDYLKQDGYDFEFAQKPFEDISSTNLRESVVNDRLIQNIVPDTVYNYIKENGLYKNETNGRN